MKSIKVIFTIFVVLLLVGLITTCDLFTVQPRANTNDSNNELNKNLVDIYVAGYYESSGERIACYWKNGARTDLEIIGDYGSIESIFVDGSDIYVAGKSQTSSTDANTRVAHYWKNGSRVDPLAPDSWLSDILVYNGDVYFSANDFVSGDNSMYFKNGIKTTLAHVYTHVYGISVYDNTVYTCGYQGATAISKYWTNSNVTELTSANDSRLLSIYVSSAGVYTCGYTNSGSISSYWVNDSRVDLMTTGQSIPYSIIENGGDVYVAGYYNDDSTYAKACYWINNGSNRISLYTDSLSIAYDIQILSDNVYITGFYEKSGVRTACYWFNGIKVDLETDNYSIAKSIFILEK